jgi:hypothetical protein
VEKMEKNTRKSIKCDDFSSYLLPVEDLKLFAGGSDYYAIHSSGNGNCLFNMFNSISIF